MKTQTYLYTDGWDKPFDESLDSKNTLVMVFTSCSVESTEQRLKELRSCYKDSFIVGASTSGEIYNDEYYEKSISVGVLQFEKTALKMKALSLSNAENSFEDGISIANTLYDDELRAIFVLSDGLHVNGSQLTKGIASVVDDKVAVTGGLAGDDDRFEHTWVVVDGHMKSPYVCGVGFYGEDFRIAYGSEGGWDKLGLQRVVTKSKNNVLYELDHRPALDIYKKYLGEKAQGLPATGLLFPLALKENLNTQESKVRTILGINEEEHSITFAGDIPEGSCVTLMKANYNRLIDGASRAAESLALQEYNNEELFCVAISCVGRRLVLKSRVEEELEAVLDALPKGTKQIGFYSYGEISPLASGRCDLHNQTMTLTLFWESVDA